ncbi:ribonucleases P/MRP protein subunit POP1-domain-containing protein [Poronia punctata]|nr:ribonucleases P/MRP protein subunit POP1-domain-containing protein [Poronia punctata]
MAPKQASQGNNGKSAAKSGQQPSNNKRRQDGSNTQANPRAAKRTKLYESRSIATQKPHDALQNGELNVQSFVNSMAFQINALDESIRRSRTSGTSRAFQRVPFTMRRRTAAHNYKRIPKRLHRRAKHEMAEDNTPTVNSKTRKPKTSKGRLRAETARRLGILAKRKRLLKLKKSLGSDTAAIATRAARPKIRRNELNDLPVTAPRFRKRQLKKTWLPTHMWHAKRARMTTHSEPLWGFSLPITPTQKNYRPTHRVQWEKGAMAWDMSYMSTIGLFGKENILIKVLMDIGLTQESLWIDRGKRWRAGAVHWTGNIGRKIKNSLRFIGPATIIWCPQVPVETPDNDPPSRQLFIRIHPSGFLETFNELLRIIKAYTPRPYIQDLRHEIGSIDVTGPDATEALLGVLKPFSSNVKDNHASRFESLLGLRDPSSLPLGALLAFSVRDPRLSYPPRKLQTPISTEQRTQIQLLGSITSFRKDEELQPYKLFDRDVRFKASRLPSQQSLNRRRGKASPGTPLEPSEVDPPIPIILLASRNGDGTRIPGTWTVMLPWMCVRPVWLTLMHYPLSTGGNPVFGGLDEIRQLAFERGQPWFPGDMPGTDAGNAWETREREVRRKIWAGKPKGKRVQWESVDLGVGRKGEVGVGWSCDFERLFTPTTDNTESNADVDTSDHEMAEAEAAATETDSHDEPKKKEKPSIISLTDITHIPKNIFTTNNQDPTTIPPNSIVTVTIKILGRGVVTPCARIYRLPPDQKATPSSQAEIPATEPPPEAKTESGLPANLYNQWLAQLPKPDNKKKNTKIILTAASTRESRRQALAQQLVQPYPSPITINGHPLCPDAADLIGFVTTGSFNLRDGRGEAVASLSARCAREEMMRKGGTRLCVVREAGQSIGWLARWELV